MGEVSEVSPSHSLSKINFWSVLFLNTAKLSWKD